MKSTEVLREAVRHAESPGMFLDDMEMRKLTGRCFKSKQIERLRAQGIPFSINATGHPVVTRAVVEGRTNTPTPLVSRWTPNAVGRA
ncbi:DUF4224 domain-containing protein [Comamonas terrigena]|uniref:DUF4224 domain-containing protein n=1 Tax=Comamonas terrigena TaxID=32013 RepID=UPI0028B22FA1|nr:DUF4224 domain-containing protein [Comamonas terrigena]